MFDMIIPLSPSRRREAPCEGTNSPRLFTPGETKALAKSKVHQLSRAWVTNTELYYITGGGAPISLQSNKCRQKHGGFRWISAFADARMTPLVPNPRGNYH